MTLLVGIRCRDNAVIVGTDSAVTLGQSPQRTTIEQPHRRKVEIVDDHIIIAGTGSVGLGQRFEDIVMHMWKDKGLKDKNAIETGRLLCQSAIKDFASTNAGQGSYGALVAIPCKKKAELIEFGTNDFQPEIKTNTSWYVSMGSGQLVADPLLGFIRTAFWGDDPPTRQDGVFAATMVLKLACNMTPFGVSLPIQMAILGPEKKGQLVARRLTEEELLEHESNVNSAIEYFKKYRDIFRGGSEMKPPVPPRDQ